MITDSPKNLNDFMARLEFLKIWRWIWWMEHTCPFVSGWFSDFSACLDVTRFEELSYVISHSFYSLVSSPVFGHLVLWHKKRIEQVKVVRTEHLHLVQELRSDLVESHYYLPENQQSLWRITIFQGKFSFQPSMFRWYCSFFGRLSEGQW